VVSQLRAILKTRVHHNQGIRRPESVATIRLGTDNKSAEAITVINDEREDEPMDSKQVASDQELEQMLAEEWLDAKVAIDRAKAKKKEIENQLSKLLDERGGRIIKHQNPRNPDNRWALERYFRPAYVQNLLDPLKELLDEDERETVYEEEYEYTKVIHVPGKWKTSQVKKLADDKGGEVKDVVERARANTVNSTPQFSMIRPTEKWTSNNPMGREQHIKYYGTSEEIDKQWEELGEQFDKADLQLEEDNNAQVSK